MSWTLATTRPSRQIEPIRPADDSGSLFACYEAIACLSEQMVDAAEAGDWDGWSANARSTWSAWAKRAPARRSRVRSCSVSATS
jgi:flagellar protein FliT